MLTIAQERSHLAKAERDVAEGERRLAKQAALIKSLKQSGHAVDQAEKLLATFTQTLEEWRAHRNEIRRVLARLEAD